jgi:uncharacterized glyoxalase superfamily protein PhnB
MSQRSPCPPHTPWVSPYLCVKDADATIDFYERAFGFQKRMAIPLPDGRTGHVEMAWKDALIMFGPEAGNRDDSRAPATTGVRSPVQLYVYCDDVDALFAQAKAAGAEMLTAPETKFWGDRMCTLRDPDGHIWCFATNVADFDPANVPH